MTTQPKNVNNNDSPKPNGLDGGSNGNHSSASSAEGDSSSGNMKLGHCKWFNVLKGFGFITPDDGSDEVFVHQSVLKMPGFRSLDAGEPVEFECKRTDRGWEATHVAGPSSSDCKGSRVHPLGRKKFQKIRCFNCGKYGNHTAGKCPMGPLEKCCYNCHGRDHLVADCPVKPPPELAGQAPKAALAK